MLAPFLLALLGLPAATFASVSVAPVSPHSIPSGSTVYYPARTLLTAFDSTGETFVDVGAGFAEITVNSAFSRIEFDVTTEGLVAEPGETLVLAVEAHRSDGTYKALPIETTGGQTCNADRCAAYDGVANAYRVALLDPNTTLRVAISPYRLCFDANGAYLGVSSCTVNGTFAAESVAAATLRFVVQSVADTSNEPAGSTSDPTITAIFQNSKLTLASTACSPQLNEVYFPGDGQILVNTHAVGGNPGAAGAPVVNLVVMASQTEGTAPAPTSASLEGQYTLVSRLPYKSGTREMGGFQNTTTGGDNAYSLRFAVRDAAGVLRPLGCAIDGVQTSEIQGVLKKSKCFVATAAAGGNDPPGLRVLRAFRERVLRPRALGRALVRLYEEFSPSAADVLLRYPVLRYPVLNLLLPVQLWAYAALAETNSPYIDLLKRRAGPAPESPSLIDAVRASPPPPKRARKPVSEPQDKEPRPSIEEERKRLLAETPPPGGAIAAVHAGTSELRPRKEGTPRFATGLHLGVTQSRSVTTTTGGQAFHSVYGTSWAPDARFLFEYQPFHSENFGSFGLVGGIGFAHFKGRGVFQYQLRNTTTGENFDTASRTKFTFSMVPASAGVNYRFNLLRILRPYAMVAPTGVLYWESRDDGGQGGQGFSTGFTYSGGVSILLNGLSRSSSWDLYSSFGILNSYATLEYNRIQTRSGDVQFDLYGLMAGLTFEY